MIPARLLLLCLVLSLTIGGCKKAEPAPLPSPDDVVAQIIKGVDVLAAPRSDGAKNGQPDNAKTIARAKTRKELKALFAEPRLAKRAISALARIDRASAKVGEATVIGETASVVIRYHNVGPRRKSARRRRGKPTNKGFLELNKTPGGWLVTVVEGFK